MQHNIELKLNDITANNTLRIHTRLFDICINHTEIISLYITQTNEHSNNTDTEIKNKKFERTILTINTTYC